MVLGDEYLSIKDTILDVTSDITMTLSAKAGATFTVTSGTCVPEHHFKEYEPLYRYMASHPAPMFPTEEFCTSTDTLETMLSISGGDDDLTTYAEITGGQIVLSDLPESF